ncbi:HlyD family secretion protein [Gloeobacter kilaueensis]|uniref:Secretion protein HlyD family protein n=1 Tax=Gloeobacter kilaueensis (strain ATCC BAA-2537 / CCAP 1431/1 / ULC 316 / JS1) TaxID=1183438 RepID=U5QJJ0_GLOK1|nr:HlyD family secretion protein [Gloeobacter kilaueensis]AGY59157.1 secretion protein HlyD family protein [Gloeobacter kilaueensis JS1]
MTAATGTTNRQNKLPRPLIFAIGAIALVLVLVFGIRWWLYAAGHEETDDAYLTGHIHQVSSRIEGTVQALLIDDNRLVKAGQTLLLLDPRDYQVALDQASAALLNARRQAQTALAGVSYSAGKAAAQSTQAAGSFSGSEAAIAAAAAAVAEAKVGIPAAQANLKQAEANLTRAQLDYNRYIKLEQEGVVARQQLDTARATYQVNVAQRDAAAEGVRQATARLAQAEQNLSNSRSKLVQSRGSIEDARATGLQTEVERRQYQAAQAAVAQAEANVRNAQLRLSYTRLVAPAAGRIGNRKVEVGQRVQPGQALLSVAEERPWVVANFKETQLAHMRPGQPVEIKVDAFGGRTFSGRVDSFSPGSGSQFALLPADNATGNFTKIVQRVPVKIVLDPASARGYEGRLLPGMSVVASVDVSEPAANR